MPGRVADGAGGDRGFCFFGAYDPCYPRNAIIRKGLRRLGYHVSECRVDTRLKVHLRYPALLWRFARVRNAGDILFVPDFRHKDVPLAWLLSRTRSRSLVFDPLVSRYETRVLDRGDVSQDSLQSWHNRNIDRLSFSLPDLVLADTEAHARFYVERYSLQPDKVRTLHIGFDDELFGEQPPPGRRDTVNVLFYGTYLPLHGIGTIVEAASLLQDAPFHFTLVGGGQTYGEMREKAAELPHGTIDFMPAVPAERLRGLIASADIVLGIFGVTDKTAMVVPNKVYQALAVGRAVVTADTQAVRELFRSGEHLVTVPPGEPRALADALEMLRTDEALRERIAAGGGDYVRRGFSTVRVAERLVEILGEAGVL